MRRRKTIEEFGVTAQAMTLVDFVRRQGRDQGSRGTRLEAMRRERPDLLLVDARELPVVLYAPPAGGSAMGRRRTAVDGLQGSL